MSMHKKHDALDQSVHSLLALTMWACAGSILLEMARPRSVLASAARSLSCIMQGMWMIQVCHNRPRVIHYRLHFHCARSAQCGMSSIGTT